MRESEEIVRNTRHSLKFCNKGKLEKVNTLFENYQKALEECIDLIIQRKIPLKALLSSKLIPLSIPMSARWKTIVYKDASIRIRSCLAESRKIRFERYKKVYKYFKEKGRMKKFTEKKFSELNLSGRFYIHPQVDKVSITLDNRFFNIREHTNSFDMFITLRLMNFDKSGLKTEGINLPIKFHKNYLKFKDWKRANTVQLTRDGKDFFINFFFKKVKTPFKEEGNEIGIDIGYKKLISTSDGDFIGSQMSKVYERIARCKRGSKRYSKCLCYRNNEMRRILNKWDLTNIKTIYVENLEGLKDRTFNNKTGSLNRKFKNKSQYALYTKVILLLEQKCEEQGIRMVKVSPEYTSQTCSRCKSINATNRQGERYKCSTCGLEIDADYNAAINILNRGAYSPSNTDKLL